MEKLLAIIRRHAEKGECVCKRCAPQSNTTDSTVGTAFSLDTLFFRFTLNSFAELAFGLDVGALSTESDEPVPFAAAFDSAQTILALRFTK